MDVPVAVEPPRKDATQELRLALVCYGGVSLAIWMHGVTKELHKLVVASERHDAEPEANPFPAGSTEHVYWELLAALEAESGIRTRVVIDIVAGTSAGGINGIVLAKALARDLDQEPVTRVWLEDGDLKRLMRSAPLRRVPTPAGKAVAWLAASLVRGFRPPLRGDLLLELMDRALDDMDARRGAGAAPVSPNNPVELHVTMTDFRGYDHAVPADWPHAITDRRHRHVLSFRDFAPASNHRLAFAARATSSFPGAFAPVAFSDVERVLRRSRDELAAFEADQWAIYGLSGADVNLTRLVDGGVLDNAPFKLAIAAIQAKPAASEVRRRLVFVQPDPPQPGGGAEGKEAGLFETVWGSSGRLPRHEPMLDDLLELQAFNERVDRVAAIVAAGTALAGVDDAGTGGDGAGATQRAIEGAGFAYASYVELKLHGVVERFAAAASELCRFPPESGQAAFVRAVLLRWARAGGLLGTGAAVTPAQVEFLSTFDLDYGERRLRYVIRRVNDCYRADPAPPRAEVNALKARLYGFVDALHRALEGVDPEPVRAVLDPGAIAAALAAHGNHDDAADAFLAERGERLGGVRDVIGARLEAALAGFGDEARAAVAGAVGSWPAESAAGVLEACDRFPFWDVLLYPIRKASETAELDRVRVRRLSPREVGLLSDAGPKKLEGAKAGHFGAFFSRRARESDYLWGRLDAAEWIVHLLCGEPARDHCAAAFSAVLASETGLREIAGLRATLAEKVAALGSG